MADIDDFDVAKKISELLRHLEGPRQDRILRWVSESLGLEVRDKRQRAGTTEGGDTVRQPDLSDATRQEGSRSETDIRTFVERKKPKSDMQFAAAVAFYYRFEASPSERRESITSEVLQEATRLVGRKRLAKPNMTLVNAKNQGYLDKLGKGEFRINSVGENLVAMTLPGNEGTKTVSAGNRRAKGKRAKAKKG